MPGKYSIAVLVFITSFIFTTQDCPQERSKNGIAVAWPSSPSGRTGIESVPVCHGSDENIITRTCNGSQWHPAADDLEACVKTIKYYDLNSCPPGFHKISSNNSYYCYQISEPSTWNFPCFKNGGASVITDMSANDVDYLLKSLGAKFNSSFFWLPARSQKNFNPIVWVIPGPNWAKRVEGSEILSINASLFKSCLALDVNKRELVARSCSNLFPSLCFYVNDMQYPSQCPKGYQEYRFMSDENVCFGIEQSDSEDGNLLNEFLETKCRKPMGNRIESLELMRFIFSKMANNLTFPDNKWCWFKSNLIIIEPKKNFTETDVESSLQVIINNEGILTLMDSRSKLSCIACETDIIQKETELFIEYYDSDMKMFLTIYFPSGLWKYNNSDTGVRCFSNAKGFSTPVAIHTSTSIELANAERTIDGMENVEQVTYWLDLAVDRTAQYWCEGHAKNYSHITTNKIIVSPRDNKDHVIAIFIEYYHSDGDSFYLNDFTTITDKMSEIFSAKNVLLMDILEFDYEYGLILFHLHISEDAYSNNKITDLNEIFTILQKKAEIELPKHNLTYLNISSPIYCLPTTSQDIFTLEWEMTSIGEITAPKQFCLQANGLPVTRRCLGSYMTGGHWGPVEGNCDINYQPSNATTFLYNFLKDKVNASNFLTDGLYFVLHDVAILIPADIYYLSMSLNQISHDAKENKSTIESSNLDNVVWAVDRLMMLDTDYLKLAQTLNSTNVILDSVTEIVEVLATLNMSDTHTKRNYDCEYQVSVKPNLVIQISYPHFNNISGIALIRKSKSVFFDDMLIQPLYKNSSLIDVLKIPNLEIATWVPEKVLNTLKLVNNETDKMNPSNLHVIIVVFYNDAIFQELEQRKHSVNSRVIEIYIPGYQSSLKYPLPLVFKDQQHVNDMQKICGYWNFQLSGSNCGIPGSWEKNGCFFSKTVNNMTTCECYHLTHFAQLISFNGFGNHLKDEILAEHHKRLLNIITIIGSSMSLLGILGIWITASTFTAWRKKPGSKVLLQLSTAIAIPLLLVIFFNLDNNIFVNVDGVYLVPPDKRLICIALGACLQYSILAGFVWMLITAVLQFVRYVRVLGVSRPSRFIMKLSVIGWGLPTLPVCVLLIVNRDNFIPGSASYGTSSGICYPTGIYNILGVLLPIGLILVVNIGLFLSVIFSISRGPDGKLRSTDLDLVKAQLRLSIFLFFLLGLTWVFGIFSFSQNLWWSYLFCLTSTIQGFVLFLYFVVCDPATRNLWISLMKPQFSTRSSRASISSVSSSST